MLALPRRLCVCLASAAPQGTEEQAVFKQATPYPLSPTWKVHPGGRPFACLAHRCLPAACLDGLGSQPASLRWLQGCKHGMPELAPLKTSMCRHLPTMPMHFCRYSACLPAWLQVILLSDGSVTRHLQLMTNRRVQVRQGALGRVGWLQLHACLLAGLMQTWSSGCASPDCCFCFGGGSSRSTAAPAPACCRATEQA